MDKSAYLTVLCLFFFFLSLLFLFSLSLAPPCLSVQVHQSMHSLCTCTHRLCRILRSCKAFFLWPLTRDEALAPNHLRNPFYLHTRCVLACKSWQANTHSHIVSLNWGTIVMGVMICIINEAGFILILIENVLSSSTLAHLSSPSVQVM